MEIFVMAMVVMTTAEWNATGGVRDSRVSAPRHAAMDLPEAMRNATI
jgi:hypothetical protein